MIIILTSFFIAVFFITAIIVMLRRREQSSQNVGYVINATSAPPGGISQTHFQQGGIPDQIYTQGGVPISQCTHSVIHVAPPNYQMSSNPYQTPSPYSVQVVASPGTYLPNHPTPQGGLSILSATVADVSVIPSNDEKRPMQQTHTGAVETVSQI